MNRLEQYICDTGLIFKRYSNLPLSQSFMSGFVVLLSNWLVTDDKKNQSKCTSCTEFSACYKMNFTKFHGITFIRLSSTSMNLHNDQLGVGFEA